MKELLTGKKKEDKRLCGKMTMKERMIGFLACCALGWLLSILSFLTLILGKKNIIKFAVVYSLGNLINILATSFLYGFDRQMKKMFHKTRIAVSIIFLGAMAGCLAVAFVVKDSPVKRLLILGLMGLQFCAYTWYSLSLIPFGRKIAKKCCNKCIKDISEN